MFGEISPQVDGCSCLPNPTLLVSQRIDYGHRLAQLQGWVADSRQSLDHAAYRGHPTGSQIERRCNWRTAPHPRDRILSPEHRTRRPRRHRQHPSGRPHGPAAPGSDGPCLQSRRCSHLHLESGPGIASFAHTQRRGICPHRDHPRSTRRHQHAEALAPPPPTRSAGPDRKHPTVASTLGASLPRKRPQSSLPETTYTPAPRELCEPDEGANAQGCYHTPDHWREPGLPVAASPPHRCSRRSSMTEQGD